MKKIMNPSQTETNKRSFAAKWASAIVCFALMLAGTSAFAAPPNDNLSGAQVVTGSSFNVSGTTEFATREAGDPTTVAFPGVGQPDRRSNAGDRSVWYQWTAPESGTFTLRTEATSGLTDTQLGVYTGSLNEVASAEDAFDPGTGNENVLGGGQSQLSFDANSGTVYTIMVNGFESADINFNLILSSGGSTNPPPPTGLSLTVNTTGSGTVTKDPSKTSYDTNEIVTLTAVPTGTNTFVSWGGDIGTNSPTANPITITMDANKTITATFTGGGGGGGNCGDLTSIIVTTNGNGKISPNLNGKTNLQVCKTYKLTATPAKDWIFDRWTGVSSNATNPKLTFVMQPGMVITANFVPNPFVPVSGTYNGLFFESNNVSTRCAGSFNLKVQKTGKFTAKFISAGKTATANGTFDATGHATGIAGKGTNAVAFDLQLQGLVGGDADKVVGSVTTGLGCLAQVEGDRQVFSSKNPAPLQGKYTFVLPRNGGPQTIAVVETNNVVVTNDPGTTNETVVTNTTFTTNFVILIELQTNEVITTNIVVVTNDPGTTNETVVTNTTFSTNTIITTNSNAIINPGHSYATLSIDKAGKVKISGELADGTKINQSTAVSKEITNGISQVPLYVSLYKGTGLLLGWLNVTLTNVSGTVNWERPPGSTTFPTGIDADIEAVGSSFNKTNNPLISITNGVVEITGFLAPIPVAFINDTTLEPTNINDTSGLSVKLQSSGLIQGKFINPLTAKSTKIRGAMLQNTNAAFGFFLLSGVGGSVELRNQQ